MTNPQIDWRQYKEICESSPDGILLVDTDGRMTYANPQVSELFGYEKDELLGERVEMLVPEGLRQEHVRQRVSYTDDPVARPMGVGLDLSGQGKDGSTFPVSIALRPIDINGGVQIMAVVRDISERETLRTKYRALLETAPDAIFVADADTGELVEVNEKAEELVGYTADELVGMDQTELHPCGEELRYRNLFEHHADSRGVLSEFPAGSQILVETRDGDRIPVEINVSTVDIDDRHLVTGAFRDISERHERERELERTETIIQATGDAVYMLTPEGRFAFVNDALERLTGYDEGDLLGEHVSKVMYQSEVETGEKLIQRLLETDRERETFEMTIIPADGEPVPTENHIAVLEDDDGSLQASVGVVREITERKERERELERQNKRLDEFASVVSHDLRNPLSIASGHLDLARGECESEHLDTVQAAHNRMDQIIEKTLTLARQGEDVGETTEVDLSHVVKECWQRVETADADLQVGPLPSVRADPSRLRHLFENLFRNAIEHGGGAVAVHVGSLEDGFFIQDDGPGISPEDRDSIFDAGYSGGEGTGLGLAIINRIVEAHGWDVSVAESDEGGARFEISGIGVDSK